MLTSTESWPPHGKGATRAAQLHPATESQRIKTKTRVSILISLLLWNSDGKTRFCLREFKSTSGANSAPLNFPVSAASPRSDMWQRHAIPPDLKSDSSPLPQDARLYPCLLHFVIKEYLTPATPPSASTSHLRKPSKEVANGERIAASQVASAADMVTRHQLLREKATIPQVSNRPSGSAVAQDAWCRRVGELMGSQQVGGSREIIGTNHEP